MVGKPFLPAGEGTTSIGIAGGVKHSRVVGRYPIFSMNWRAEDSGTDILSVMK